MKGAKYASRLFENLLHLSIPPERSHNQSHLQDVVPYISRFLGTLIKLVGSFFRNLLLMKYAMITYFCRNSISFFIFSSSSQTSTTCVFDKRLVQFPTNPSSNFSHHIVQLKLMAANLSKFVVEAINSSSILSVLLAFSTIRPSFETIGASGTWASLALSTSEYVVISNTNCMSSQRDNCGINPPLLEYKS